MNCVNGSKFHMLLGRTDWGACVSVAGALSGEWDDRDAQGAEIDTIDQSIPSWDSESRRLSLAQIPEHCRRPKVNNNWSLPTVGLRQRTVRAMSMRFRPTARRLRLLLPPLPHPIHSGPQTT